MFEKIVRDRSYYERRIADTAASLERARVVNDQVDTLREEHDNIRSVASEVQLYRDDLSLLKTAVTTEINEYQNRRIEYLNNLITDSLAEIFPERGWIADIRCDFSRKNICKLVLKDRNGHVSLPKVGQGKLLQYLISFAAVAGITKGLGYNNLFIDEAFGVAAVKRLSDIGDIIKKQIEDGMQIILVSQNPSLYNQLPRHVYNLKTITDCDGAVPRVAVESEEDY